MIESTSPNEYFCFIFRITTEKLQENCVGYLMWACLQFMHTFLRHCLGWWQSGHSGQQQGIVYKQMQVHPFYFLWSVKWSAQSIITKCHLFFNKTLQIQVKSRTEIIEFVSNELHMEYYLYLRGEQIKLVHIRYPPLYCSGLAICCQAKISLGKTRSFPFDISFAKPNEQEECIKFSI